MARAARAPRASTPEVPQDREVPAYLQEYAGEEDTGPAPADLEAIRRRAAVLRDKIAEKEDYDERSKQLGAEINDIQSRELPEMFTAIGIDRIGVAAEGNKPPLDFEMKPWYKAVIPEKTAQAALTLLRDKFDLGDIISTKVTVYFGLTQDKLAQRVIRGLEKVGLVSGQDFEVKSSVHHGTLTAAYRQLVEKGKEPSDAEKLILGAKSGQVVKPKDRRTS